MNSNLVIRFQKLFDRLFQKKACRTYFQTDERCTLEFWFVFSQNYKFWSLKVDPFVTSQFIRFLHRYIHHTHFICKHTSSDILNVKIFTKLSLRRTPQSLGFAFSHRFACHWEERRNFLSTLSTTHFWTLYLTRRFHKAKDLLNFSASFCFLKEVKDLCSSSQWQGILEIYTWVSFCGFCCLINQWYCTIKKS